VEEGQWPWAGPSYNVALKVGCYQVCCLRPGRHIIEPYGLAVPLTKTESLYPSPASLVPFPYDCWNVGAGMMILSKHVARTSCHTNTRIQIAIREKELFAGEVLAVLQPGGRKQSSTDPRSHAPLASFACFGLGGFWLLAGAAVASLGIVFLFFVIALVSCPSLKEKPLGPWDPVVRSLGYPVPGLAISIVSKADAP